MKDKCLDLKVIPQFKGTCWLNAIMMACFYSQGSQYLVKKIARTWKKDNSLLMFFKKVVFNIHKNPLLVKNLFKKFKPEIILFKLLEQTKDKNLIEVFKQNNLNNINKFGFYPEYIIDFYKFLGLKVLDISVSKFSDSLAIYYCNLKDYFYVNYKGNVILDEDKYTKDKEREQNTRKKINDIPDVLIVINTNDNRFSLYNIITRKIQSYNHKYNLLGYYTDNFSGISKNKNVIKFNGHKYKLDSVILNNYNIKEIKSGHGVAGITCDNNKYVYNGWSKFTDDPANLNKNENSVNPCSLMKYDWDLHKDQEFCFNMKHCKLDFDINKEDVCFSFNKGNRILVYTRIVDEDVDDIDDIDDDVEELKELSNIDEVIIDIFNINSLNLEGLKSIYSSLNSELGYLDLTVLDKSIEEIREAIKPLLVEYFYNFNKKHKINGYIKNIDKLEYWQLLFLFSILKGEYKLPLNPDYIKSNYNYPNNDEEILRDYLKEQIKGKFFNSQSTQSLSSEATLEIKLNGKNYKLDKDKCNLWISNKDINPFTNRKIGITSPIRKILDEACKKLGIEERKEEREKEREKEHKEEREKGRQEINDEVCLKWMKDKTKNPLTKRTIKKDGDVYKKFVKACSHLI
jgi:hypothetical protein